MVANFGYKNVRLILCYFLDIPRKYIREQNISIAKLFMEQISKTLKRSNNFMIEASTRDFYILYAYFCV